MNISKISDSGFFRAFKMADPNDGELMKSLFREVFINRPHLSFEKELTPGFCTIAAAALPAMLSKTVKAKNAFEIVTGRETVTKLFEEIPLARPVMVREAGKSDPLGVVRFKAVKAVNDKVFEYEILDSIPFVSKSKNADLVAKFNDEKMQMFSVVYRAFDSWGQGDTDGDAVDSEELRKAVVYAAENGVGLNIQHNNTDSVGKTDALIVEFYQSKNNFNYDGLEVRKGDLVATTQFYDTPRGRELWNDLKNGEYSTYSMEGSWTPDGEGD